MSAGRPPSQMEEATPTSTSLLSPLAAIESSRLSGWEGIKVRQGNGPSPWLASHLCPGQKRTQAFSCTPACPPFPKEKKKGDEEENLSAEGRTARRWRDSSQDPAWRALTSCSWGSICFGAAYRAEERLSRRAKRQSAILAHGRPLGRASAGLEHERQKPSSADRARSEAAPTSRKRGEASGRSQFRLRLSRVWLERGRALGGVFP